MNNYYSMTFSKKNQETETKGSDTCLISFVLFRQMSHHASFPNSGLQIENNCSDLSF